MPSRSIYSRLVLALVLVAPDSHATSPCRVEGGCIDEASAALAGSLDVYEIKCIEADPDHAERYHEAVRKVFANEDAQFLRRLRASTIYAEVTKQIEADANRMERQKLFKSCENFISDH
jgi:hypothetical protein